MTGKLPDTLTERISALCDVADDLESSIRGLRKELDKWEGIEAITHLADVPGHIENAKGLVDKLYEELEMAESCARKGGQ